VINSKIIDEILLTLQEPSARIYFFNAITSPKWIKPLYDRGVFEEPTASPITGHYLAHQDWPEIRYLVRMAELAPKEVCEILIQIDLNHVAVARDFIVAAALKMPPEESGILATKILETLLGDKPFAMYIPIAELVSYLREQGQTDLAYKMTYALLDVVSQGDPVFPTITSRMSDWEFAKIVTRFVIATKPDELPAVVNLFIALLLKATQFSDNEPEHGLTAQDKSLFWRRAIEETDQDKYSDQILGALIRAVRDLSLQLAKVDDMHLKSVVVLLLNFQKNIFRRIAMYLLTKVAPSNPIALEMMNQTELMVNLDLHHEYWLLAREIVPRMPDFKQKEFLLKLQRAISESDIAPGARTGGEYLRLSVLEPSREGPLLDRFKALGSEFESPPENPSFLMFHSVTSVDHKSPISMDSIIAFSPDELVEFTKSWQEPGAWIEPSIAGLLQALTDASRTLPRIFLEHWDSYLNLEPIYLLAVVEGLDKANWVEDSYPWEALLRYGRSLVYVESATEAGSEAESNHQGLVSSKKKFLGIISTGLNPGSTEIPYSLKENLWTLLESLLRDENPNAGSETAESLASGDLIFFAINSIRGVALDCILRYAVWSCRKTGSQQLVSEVKRTLETLLAPTGERSLSVRALLGKWLPTLIYLDESWTANHLDSIMEDGLAPNSIGQFAWNAYLMYALPKPGNLALLRRYYQERLGALSTDLLQDGDGSESPLTRFGEHLALFVIWGDLSMNDSLMTTYLSNANRRLCSSLVSNVSRMIDNSENIPEEMSSRAKVFWSCFALAMKDRGNEFSVTFEAFGWWFTNEAFSYSWRQEELRKVLLLTRGQIGMPDQVLECVNDHIDSDLNSNLIICDLIVSSTVEIWELSGVEAEITSIIASGMNSGNIGDKDRARQIVGSLLRKGLGQYQAVLNTEE
jgi:hypothetical protein